MPELYRSERTQMDLGEHGAANLRSAAAIWRFAPGTADSQDFAPLPSTGGVAELNRIKLARERTRPPKCRFSKSLFPVCSPWDIFWGLARNQKL